MSVNTVYLFEIFLLFRIQGIKSAHLFNHQKTGKLKNIMLWKLEQKIMFSCTGMSSLPKDIRH